MTNHVHVLLTPVTPEGPSILMRKLGQRYVPYFNRRYGRTGTLWEGRFKSCLVESARYVLACHRYIECNPVRAGMVQRPAAYPWSSYHANAGLADDAWMAVTRWWAMRSSANSPGAPYAPCRKTSRDPDERKIRS